MKAHQSSSSFIIAILLGMSVFNLSLNVLAAHQDDTAATLRGNAVVGQEERILGGNGGGGGSGGGGGGGGKDKTPAPTNASTLAPTSFPITPKPTPGTNSCGTRPPTTPKPTTSSPTPPPAPECVSAGGACGGGSNPSCCDGLKCQGKTCRVAARRNLRVEQAKSFPFQTSAADASHRKLDQCTDKTDSCNTVNGNPVICPPDIPSNAEELYSVICNYEDNLQYKADVDPCDSNSNFCCDDGFGGFYYPASCWGANVQCCQKGYTKNLHGNGCIPLNCCDGNGDFKNDYCPNC